MLVSDEEKRWIVVGIAMFQVTAPVLRDFLKQGMDSHYANLEAYCSGLATPCTLKTLTYHHVNPDTNLRRLKFQNINNNSQLHGTNKSLYNYNINSSLDLAKLYLPDYLAKFSAFDESLDMTAILRLLGLANYWPAPIFSPLIQTSAGDVRENVRNNWGHFDITEWTEAFFNDCFAKLEALVKGLGLASGVEMTMLNHLKDWQTKGCQLCMGHAVDQHLFSLVQRDLKELITKHREMKADISDLKDQQTSTRDQLEKHDEQFEELRKENEEILKRLVCVEKTWNEELQTLQRRVEEGFAGVESKLSQTDVAVKQLGRKSEQQEEKVKQHEEKLEYVEKSIKQQAKKIGLLEQEARSQWKSDIKRAIQSPPPQGQGPIPPLQSPGGSRNQGMRQMGDVEGVRLVHGNVPVIQDVAEADTVAWRNRRIVPNMKPSVAKCDEERRLMQGREEMNHYLREKKRRALPSTSKRITVPVPEPRTVEQRPQQASRRTTSRRTAGQHSRGTRRPAYSTRASASLDVEESAEEETAATPSDTEEEDEEEEWSESSRCTCVQLGGKARD